MLYVEIAANLFAVICIFLAGLNKIHTWWTGIISCILFGILFYHANLYADVTLQIFFIVTGVVGWYNWRDNASHTLAIEFEKFKPMIYMASLSFLVAISYGWLLHNFTNAYMPFVDSAVLVLSVMGQFLLMKRKVQSWPVWLLVNTLSVPLYFSRELYITSALYSVFWVNALVSWIRWHKIAKRNNVLG